MAGTEVEEVVPELDHRRIERARRPLEIPVPPLGVLHHQPQAGHAMGGEIRHVALDTGQIPAAEKPLQIHPGDGVVLTDRSPALATVGLEVRGSGGDLDPGKLGRRGLGAADTAHTAWRS